MKNFSSLFFFITTHIFVILKYEEFQKSVGIYQVYWYKM